jgi:hypothetical protein
MWAPARAFVGIMAETCAVACAVQNLHLQLTADGYVGYWSSGGNRMC